MSAKHILPKQAWALGSARSVMANVLDFEHDGSEFELQSFYYVHFGTHALGKVINLLIPPGMAYPFCLSTRMNFALNDP